MGRPKAAKKKSKPKVAPNVVHVELVEEETTQVAFRLSAGLLAALDTEATILGSRTPGVTFTRADAMRSILSAYNADPAHVDALKEIREGERVRFERARLEQEHRQKS